MLKLEVLARARSKEKTTSSAVKSVPSLNLTPLRRLKRCCVGVTSRQEVAKRGSILKVLLL